MSDIPALSALGYSPRWQAFFAQSEGPDGHPARIVRTDQCSALIAAQDGPFRAKPSTAREGRPLPHRPARRRWSGCRSRATAEASGR